jgi:hypothetical protein
MYYRKDSWVQNAMGEALAGSELYVCEQPANLAVFPPTPLTNVWLDPDGITLIQDQPLVSDGTGHFVYYAESDLYTEVYYYRGQMYRVLLDQGVGCYCTGGGGGGGGGAGLLGIPTASAIGAPTPGVPVLVYTAYTPMTFPPNFSNPTSFGSCRIAPAAPSVYIVQASGTNVGTAAVDTNGVFSFSTPGFALAAGGMLVVMPPDPPDPQMSDVAITLVAGI